MIDIMDNLDAKRELAHSLYDKVSKNSTKWAESEDFEKMIRELISIYDRIRSEVHGQSSLEKTQEKMTELSTLFPPPNMQYFSSRISKTASITDA